jgi:hypothetical protein
MFQRIAAWMETAGRRRAARRFARVLPPLMIKGWGASETYTVGQVRAALRSARLDGPHDVIAYAGLLIEADFLASEAGRLGLLYPQARELFMQALPGGSWASYLQQSISNEDAVRSHGIGG